MILGIFGIFEKVGFSLRERGWKPVRGNGGQKRDRGGVVGGVGGVGVRMLGLLSISSLSLSLSFLVGDVE